MARLGWTLDPNGAPTVLRGAAFIVAPFGRDAFNRVKVFGQQRSSKFEQFNCWYSGKAILPGGYRSTQSISLTQFTH